MFRKHNNIYTNAILYDCYQYYKQYIDDLCRIYFKYEIFDVSG